MIQRLKIKLFVLITTFSLLTLSSFQVLAAPTVTTNGLLQYSSLSEFQTAFPGLPVEDFEESTVAIAGVIAQPLNNTTSNAYFSPGDILPGIAITTEGGYDPGNELIISTAGYLSWTNTSKAITNNFYQNDLTLDFSSSSITTVGFDLFMHSLTGTTIDINVYTVGNSLVDTVTVTLTTPPTFAGIHSPVRITKITFAPTPSTEYVGIDNIRFGTVTSDLTFYTNQATFEAAHPGLPLEDFEESSVGDAASISFSGPLDSTTDGATSGGAFLPGDILDGLQINTLPSTSLFVVGGNYSTFGNTSKAVGENAFADYSEINFTGTSYNVYAAGMDLMHVSIPGTSTIVVYGYNGVLLGMVQYTLSTSASFFGVYSNQPLTRIDIINSTEPIMVDNIQFGGSPMGLTFYTDLATFTGLKNEDFSESPVAVKTYCDEPFESSTNNACFSPGDITPGISFQTLDNTNCPACMAVYPPDACNVGIPPTPPTPSTPLIHSPGDNIQIDFTGTVKKIGFNVLSQPFLAYIYDTNGTLLGAVFFPGSPCPTIGNLGVKSDKPIGKIVLGQLNEAVYITNVLFDSGFQWPMFLPAIIK